MTEHPGFDPIDRGEEVVTVDRYCIDCKYSVLRFGYYGCRHPEILREWRRPVSSSDYYVAGRLEAPDRGYPICSAERVGRSSLCGSDGKLWEGRRPSIARSTIRFCIQRVRTWHWCVAWILLMILLVFLP